ncbi:MAG: hypothetical protein H6651_23470 [Ardenticatenales bacterium]|nr:hypothetical protein [Ardenticatenales bacterium]
MSTNGITFFLNCRRQADQTSTPPVSLTNLGDGQSMQFNSLDSALNFLDATYPTQPAGGQQGNSQPANGKSVR